MSHTNEARSTNFILSCGMHKELTLAVQSANVTEAVLNSAPYAAGPKDLKIPSNKIDNTPLIAQFIVSENHSEWIDVYRWMLTCKNTDAAHLKMTDACELIALDSQNQPSTRFVYMDAWPTILDGMSYAINDEGSMVITSNVTLNFNSFKIITASGEVIDEQYTA